MWPSSFPDGATLTLGAFIAVLERVSQLFFYPNNYMCRILLHCATRQPSASTQLHLPSKAPAVAQVG